MSLRRLEILGNLNNEEAEMLFAIVNEVFPVFRSRKLEFGEIKSIKWPLLEEKIVNSGPRLMSGAESIYRGLIKKFGLWHAIEKTDRKSRLFRKVQNLA